MVLVHDTSSYGALQLYIAFMVVNLQRGHEIAITPKISKAELWFLYMTHRLIVL